MNNPFKTCLITNGSQRSEVICRRLLEQGFKFDAVIHTLPLSWMECSRRYKKLNLFNPLSILLVSRLCIVNNLKRQSLKNHFLRYSKDVFFSEKLNSSSMQLLLKSLKMDYLVVGDAGLLKQNIISTVFQGVLNGHPGLLPFVRGTGVVGRSLQKGIAVGATIHFINAGIDEGDIVKRRLLDTRSPFENLKAVEIKADDLTIDLLCEIIIDEIAKGIAPKRIPQTKKYSYCRWLNEEERKEIDKLVKDGLPLQLYSNWIVHCKPGTADLKDDIMEII